MMDQIAIVVLLLVMVVVLMVMELTVATIQTTFLILILITQKQLNQQLYHLVGVLRVLGIIIVMIDIIK